MAITDSEWQEGQRSDERQHERGIQERQILGKKGPGQKGAGRVWVATGQPSLGRHERDLDVDADRVSGQELAEGVGHHQHKDRRQDDRDPVLSDRLGEIHALSMSAHVGRRIGCVAMAVDVPRLFASRRVRWVFIAASVLGLIIGLDTLVLHLRLDPLADVRAYYDAGARLNAGQPLYIQPATTDDPGFYRYPPLLAIAFRPLALLPYETAALIWEAFLIVLFVATLVRLGLRNQWTWIVTGWLAAPIAWSLAIGQAQVAVTFLVALGSPWAIALAANLKILPIIVAVYWIGRRDWRAVGVLVGWLIGLALLQFVLEPAGTIAVHQLLGPRPGRQRREPLALRHLADPVGCLRPRVPGARAALRTEAGRLGLGGLGVRVDQPPPPHVSVVDAAGRGQVS